MQDESFGDAALDEQALLAGRYQLQSRLGSGAMGEVYRGRDLELDREVAIKVALPQDVGDGAFVERFMRQARALARIDHPGVVRVFDRGMHEARLPFVVMELLSGRDLCEVLRVQGRPSLEHALSLSAQIASALEQVHAAGVVHRDLKPGNVMLLDGGPGLVAKLVDFGIAKVEAQHGVTHSRELLGTLGYLAPELFDSAHQASPASDVYALGCIVFELLTGRRPFHDQPQSALAQRVRSEPPPTPRALAPELPAELDVLVRRMLDRDTRQRPSAAEVQRALLTVARAPSHRFTLAQRGWPVPGDVLAQRFELLRPLGEGRTSLVYEARDREQDKLVALKVLRGLHGDEQFRLKREYRTLQDVSHPNIVAIDALFFEEARAFLTMELLEGPAFMVHAAGALTSSLRQLLSALCTLHERGLIHRDLKPSNIRVAADGRVVLLDLGLVSAGEDALEVAGTPPYMAPELRQGIVTPAADMYALGVVLQELLSGARPTGEGGSLDEPLSALCTELLAQDPTARPSARAALRRLDREAPAQEVSPSSLVQRAPAFVGRERELSLLLSAAERIARTGHMECKLVQGPSGIGKTTLIDTLARRMPVGTLTLVGRCREAETLPYPALDGAIDALSEHLLRLPPLVLRYLLPRDAATLPLLFPVLGRVPPLSEAGSQELPTDPHQLRSRAFRAFKELLRRLADRHPLLLVIDDAQWIDPDSAALLAFCFSEPAPTPALMVLALRDDATAELAMLTSALASPPERVELGPLPPASARQLARSFWPDAAPDEPALQRVVTQSGGHPFLLSVLAAHAQAHAELREPSLDEALLARIRALSPGARRMLELVAVSARPLSRSLLLSLCGPSGPSSLHQLQRAQLVQRQRARGEVELDVYHARVRESTLRALDPQVARTHHAMLAGALGALPDRAEAYIEHLAAAGELERAAAVALRAARAAEASLAFERAAALYAAARPLRASAGEPPVALLEREAAALINAGRLRRAGLRLHEAAALCEGEKAEALLREAGKQLLLAGDIESGLAVLAPLLVRHGVELPTGFGAVVDAAMRAQRALTARGLTPSTEPRGERARGELLLLLAQALAHSDMRGVPCAFEALHGALELGDPVHLQRALAVFVIGTASHMNTPLIRPALALCAELTRGQGAYAHALLYAAEAEAAHLSARFLDAEAAFERAERLLVESCIGATRELSTVRNGAAMLQFAHKGDFLSTVPRTLEWLRDAEAREDCFHASMLRVTLSFVWVAHDEPQRARRELARAERDWASADGMFEVVTVLYHDIVDRYLQRDDAHLYPAQGRQHVLDSPAVQSSFLGGYVELHRCWGALRALSRGDHAHGEAQLAERSIDALSRRSGGVWEAVTLAYRANLQFLRNQREEALGALDDGEQIARQNDMRCLAAMIRHRRGELAGGEHGAELVRTAEGELRSLGVVCPERFLAAYYAPFAPDVVQNVTIAS